MASGLPGLDVLEAEGRRVILRVDVNAPIEHGRVADRNRIAGAAVPIRALLKHGAGVVVLAHQGRRGKDDFVSLRQHAGILGEILGRDVAFAPHISDTEALTAVESVHEGSVLVLENVRMAPGETDDVPADEHANREWVRSLAGVCDAYVNDAFSASHRSHASLTGFPLLLPSAAGPLLSEEVDALEKARDAEGSRIFILGGAKVEDAMRVLTHHLEADLLDAALLGGLVGELFLVARGHDLGAPTQAVLGRAEALQYLPMAEALLERFDDRIVTPEDVGVETGGGARKDLLIDELPANHRVLDIGPETVATFGRHIAAAETLVVNGPMGMYESPLFDAGTRDVLAAVAGSEAWSVVGGGHTVTAMERFKMDRSRFGHVSLAGGALITYLTGDPLPGLEALKESARRFSMTKAA